MFYETMKDFRVEEYSILCGSDNRRRSYNEYNVGYMSHFYYLMGPTIFHYVLPIPKGFHFVLNEDCPVFLKNKQPSNLEMVKYLSRANQEYAKILNSPENEPEYFIGLAHKHYDGKEVV